MGKYNLHISGRGNLVELTHTHSCGTHKHSTKCSVCLRNIRVNIKYTLRKTRIKYFIPSIICN